MANVDNLNFKVIIDDKQFNQKIKAMEDMAKKFNTSMSNLLNVQAVSQQLVVSNRKRLQMETDLVRATEMQNREKIKTEGLQRKINAQIERASKGYQSQSRILQELKGYALGYLSIHGASQLLSSLVRVTGEFELQKTTLAAMLGDLNAAEGVISRIQGLAVESPFQFKGLTTYAKQLSAFSVPAQELYDTTKMLADISAGLGVGMDRIVLAYGQVRSAAFLRGQEVRQFTEAGIPILDELAKQFSELEDRAVSTGEVFDKISARLVPFEMVAKVFKDMTSEGGKFYNMQEVQAETLRGKISNLKDAYEVMLNEIGSGQSEKLKGAVDWARRLMQNYEETGRTLVGLVGAYGVYKTAMIAIDIATKTFTETNYKLIASFVKIGKWVATNPYALLAVGLGGAVGLIYKAATAQSTFEKASSITKDTLADYNKTLQSEQGLLDYLLKRLERLTVGTTEYNEVKSQILRDYGQYLSDVDKENLAVGKLAGMYDKLAESILNSQKQRALQEGNENLTQQFQSEYDSIFSRFNQTIEALGIENQGIKQALGDYVRGSIGLEELPEEALSAVKDAQARINAAAMTGGGMFGNGINFLGFDFTRLRNDLSQVTAIIEDERGNLSRSLDVIYGPMPKAPDTIKLIEGWRKTVQDTLSGMGLNKGTSFGLWAEDTTQSTEYVDDMIKRYKELGEQIKNVSSFDPDQTERLKQNKEAIEAIAKALNIDIKNLAANKSDTTESKEEKRLKNLIETLRKLQDQYEKLKALGVSDESIRTLFEGFFPELGKDFFKDFNFLDRAKEAAEELKKYAPEDAARILVDIDKDDISDYNAKLQTAFNSAKKYYDSMRKLQTEDFNLDGKGIALDIGKIATDLSSKTQGIDLNAKKLKETLSGIDLKDEKVLMGVKDAFNKEFGEGSWDIFYEEFLLQGENAITAFADKQKAYEKRLAQEKVSDLAQKQFGESTGNLNLSDWGDKSIRQIEQIRQRLITLMNSDIKLPQSTLDALNKLGLSTDDLIAKLKELYGEALENATTEKLKAIADRIGEISSAADTLGDQLAELGETTGSDFLKGFGKTLSYFTELTDILTECNSLMELFADKGEDSKKKTEDVVNSVVEVADGAEGAAEGMENIAKSSDWITMIIKLAVSLIGQVIDGINGSQQALHDANMAAIEYANSLKQIEFDNLMGSFDTVFGTNELGKFYAAAEKTKGYLDAIKESSKGIGGTKGHKEEDKKNGIISWGYKYDMGRDHDVGEIVVDQRTGWQRFWGTGDNLLQSYSIDDFFDESGMLKGDELRTFYETYGDDISSANKEAIESMLGDWDLYVQAQEEITSYLSDIFGEVAGSMADSFIESFKASGEAALDYADIMDSVATNIAKSVVQSMIVDQIFTPDKVKQVSDLLFSGDEAGAMAVVDEAMRSAQELTPRIQEFLESMEPYFKMEDMESQNLGDGIKGITEDTANLLASYLNAIRADVSYARTIWERMDATTQQIAAILVNFSVPNLMEYQAQIAANTYNTAMHTQSIMEDLRSMMTSEGGYTALRVYS